MPEIPPPLSFAAPQKPKQTPAEWAAGLDDAGQEALSQIAMDLLSILRHPTKASVSRIVDLSRTPQQYGGVVKLHLHMAHFEELRQELGAIRRAAWPDGPRIDQTVLQGMDALLDNDRRCAVLLAAGFTPEEKKRVTLTIKGFAKVKPTVREWKQFKPAVEKFVNQRCRVIAGPAGGEWQLGLGVDAWWIDEAYLEVCE